MVRGRFVGAAHDGRGSRDGQSRRSSRRRCVGRSEGLFAGYDHRCLRCLPDRGCGRRDARRLVPRLQAAGGCGGGAHGRRHPARRGCRAGRRSGGDRLRHDAQERPHGQRRDGQGLGCHAGFVRLDRQAAAGPRGGSYGDRQFERQPAGRRDGACARHQFDQRVECAAGRRRRSAHGRRRQPDERQSGDRRVDRGAEGRLGHGDLRFARRQRRHHGDDQIGPAGPKQRLVLGQGGRRRLQRPARLLARSRADGASGERILRKRRRRGPLYGQDLGGRHLLSLHLGDRERRVALPHAVGRPCVPYLRDAGLQRRRRGERQEQPLLRESGLLRRRGHAAQRRLREVYGGHVLRPQGRPRRFAEDQGGLRARFPHL